MRILSMKKEAVRLEINHNPQELALAAIRNGIINYNASVLGEKTEKFVVTLTLDTDTIIGGAIVNTSSESIYVDILWVSDRYKNKGYGTKILNEAEKEGVNRGCKYSTLDTFGFQAEEFYIKNGYKRIGLIHDYILGHERIFLRKNI